MIGENENPSSLQHLAWKRIKEDLQSMVDEGESFVVLIAKYFDLGRRYFYCPEVDFAQVVAGPLPLDVEILSREPSTEWLGGAIGSLPPIAMNVVKMKEKKIGRIRRRREEPSRTRNGRQPAQGPRSRIGTCW